MGCGSSSRIPSLNPSPALSPTASTSGTAVVHEPVAEVAVAAVVEDAKPVKAKRAYKQGGEARLDGIESRGTLKLKEELLSTPGPAYNKDAVPRKSLLKTSSYLGSELLGLVKKHPELQPVAFILAGCTACAMSARCLKMDCSRIAKILEQVELALCKIAGHLQQHLASSHIADLIAVLDDTMQVLVKLKQPKSAALANDVVVIATGGVFGKLRNRLTNCIKSFEQGSWQAEAEVDIMGLAAFHESSAVAKATVGWGSDLTLEVADMEVAIAKAGNTCTADVLLEMDMCEMIAASDGMLFEEEQGDPGPLPDEPTNEADMYNNIIYSQARQMQALLDTGMKPTTFLQRFPLASNEAARLLFLQKHQLERTCKQLDTSDITEQLQAAFKAPYVGCYVIGWESNRLLHCRVDGAMCGKEPGSVHIQKGRVQARKFSLCQHTIASSKTIVSVPIEDLPYCFDAALFACPGLCMVDGGVADQAGRLGNQGSDVLIEEFCQLVQTGAYMIAAGMRIQHVGTAVVVQGIKVGSICILHPPEAYNDAAERLLLESAAEVGRRIEELIARPKDGVIAH